MTRLFSLIPYLWIPFIVMSRVGGTNAFQGNGLSRIIPTAFIYSPLFYKREKIDVPPTIVRTPFSEAKTKQEQGETTFSFAKGVREITEDEPPSKDNVPEEEPMDHGELEWDFTPEKMPKPPLSFNGVRTPTFTQHNSMLSVTFIVRWFRMCLDDCFRGISLYKEHDDPIQIIFLFV